ncbi:hypothetical protein RMATCC62417_04981 [Rhizopus microsporus]|nr:hypothetical protein RMATCC62417_04981 [Rhizopus microsporus]
MFPEGYFYILSRKHGFALDVYDGQTTEGANIIVWPQKFQDSDNQLWSFVNGRLINKKSGHALDISSSAFKKDKTIVQKKVKASKQSQEWVYDQGFICSKEYPTLVLDIRGDSAKGGAQILLYKRKETDNLNQQWHFEPYQQFEHALNIATTSLPLHKKEGFGIPTLGYGAEVGAPPELTKLPDDIKVAGAGNNVNPTPTTDGPDQSRIDPALAQYGSFYGEANFPVPSSQAYPKPSGNVDHSYPPPPQLQPSPGYPQPAPSTSSPSYPPNIQQNVGYPPPAGYPQPPTSPSHFPEPFPGSSGHQGQSNISAYPPPSSMPGYPPSGNYPQAPPSASNYMNAPPSYPNNTGYPPASFSPNPSNAGYPPPPNVYPPPSNDNKPPEHQYGYPPYPQ